MSTTNLTLGRGKLYFAPYLPGTELVNGERYFGNTPGFSLQVETQTLDHYSSDEGLRNKDKSLTLQVDYMATVVTDNVSAENLALFFLGERLTESTLAAPGQTDNLTVSPDMFYQLGMTTANLSGSRMVSNVVVTEVAGGVTVYTAGTDYVVEAELGRVHILPTGTIPADQAVTIGYDVAAFSAEKIVSGTEQTEGQLHYVAANAAGANRDLLLPKVSIRPNGEFNLKGDEWAQMSFNVEALKLAANANVILNGRPII
jgi:hypothetical protein